jgi:hypothetical protein
MVRPFGKSLVALLLIAALVLPSPVWACPFCSAQSQTFSEEMETMDAVVIARLVAPPTPVDAANPTDAVSKAKFEVVENLKGADLAPPKSKVEALYYGDAEVGRQFLIMGVVEGKEDAKSAVVWSTPIATTPRSREYLAKLAKLPKSGAERLVFFQSHLEDKEEILARDAYDEFAKAPYEEVKKLKSKMNHDQLVKWIKDSEIPASRRRLYLTMLGVCGTEQDIPMLAEMLKSDTKQNKSGLDALIACYLTLKGPEGVALVEDLYLKNKKAEYADTYAAIMALRFHGTESDVVPVKRIVEALRHMLDRPELADLVIPDLARWEDWESLDRLVALFKNADEKSSWVRTPVVNFVRACPLPEAKEKLKELEKIDPAAVKRANTFFPFGPPKPPVDAKTSSAVPPPVPQDAIASEVASGPAVSGPVAKAVTDRPNDASKQRKTAAANMGAAPAAAVREKPVQAPNRWLLLGVTALSGMGLLALQWSLLTGGRR